jgi:hypothetical protein
VKYIHVKWVHSFPDEPIHLYCELDTDRLVTRKVELWADGSKGFAGRDEQSGSTQLSVEPVPMLDEIASDPQFEPAVITQEEFESVWQSRNYPHQRAIDR